LRGLTARRYAPCRAQASFSERTGESCLRPTERSCGRTTRRQASDSYRRDVTVRPRRPKECDMDITPAAARWIVASAWVTAAVGTLVGQLHALARFVAHPGDLMESPLTR